MRKILFSILFPVIAMSGVLFASCEKWLETAPPTEIREETMFNSVSGFQQALYGCYISMTTTGLYSELLTFRVPEVLAHQYSLHTQSYDIGLYSYNYTGSLPKSVIKSIWEYSYNTIVNANNALKYIDLNKDVLDPINYNIIKGELLTMRAFLHFDLMRLFGVSNLTERTDKDTKLTIPYVTEVSKSIAIQRSYSETIALMVSDLTAAMVLLKDIDPITNTYPISYYDDINQDKFFNDRQQRFNYYAAKTLLARVYMWEGSQESLLKARSLAVETIAEIEDNSDIAWITTGAGASLDPILSSEHILSLDVINLWKRTLNYFTTTPTNYEALYITLSRAYEVYEVPTTDYRFTSMLSYHASTQETYTSRKYLLNATISTTTGTSVMTHYTVPLMRLPELYYMAAECYTRQANPDYSNALRYLNHVRSFRGLTEELSGIDDELTMMNEIRKEYLKEFFSEGQMFYYYKRTGETSIPDYLEDADDAIYMLPYPDIEIQLGRVQ